MNKPESEGVPASAVQTLQIVISALVLGTLTFAVIACVLREQKPIFVAGSLPVVSLAALVFAAVMLVVRAAVIPAIRKAGRKKLLAAPSVTTKDLTAQYMARTITGAALLEGGAFFLLMAYLVEGVPLTLACGLVMGGLIAVLQFPTRRRVEAAIAADRQAIENDRVPN
jgi:hypothetical protein